jgi:hypothetical protein
MHTLLLAGSLLIQQTLIKTPLLSQPVGFLAIKDTPSTRLVSQRENNYSPKEPEQSERGCD